MARIGLSSLRYAVLTDESPLTYEAPASIGKAIAAKVGLELNSAELYADNIMAESDYTFSKGNIALTIDDDSDAVLAALLGRTLGTSPAEVIRKSSDAAPYVGVGRIITKLVNGVYKYKAEFLYKVKFMEVMPEDKTKGDKIEFGTVELSGAIHTLADEKWSASATFPTVAEAQEYLDTCFGVEEA